MRLRLPTLWIWAGRDALRRPFELLLASLAIGSLVTVLSVALLLTQGLVRSAKRVLDDGPGLVVRRLDSGGWAPMPLDAAARAKAVRGVVRVRARSWGVVRSHDQAVTVVAAGSTESAAVGSNGPAKGKALVGPALQRKAGQRLTLQGVVTRTFDVQRALPSASGLVSHDMVILAPSDARSLLGLAKGTASDLAIWVFHDSELDAIRPDLARAFPFPVTITTRRESLGAITSQVERAAGVRVTVLIPALLALALLTLAIARIQLGARRDIGLLKAMGWSSADVLRLHIFRALIVALPATALGWGLAYGLVFVWGASWAAPLLLGWTGPAPHLSLDATGAVVTLLEVGGLVLAPWLAAVVFPALRSSTTDPEIWLRGEEG